MLISIVATCNFYEEPQNFLGLIVLYISSFKRVKYGKKQMKEVWEIREIGFAISFLLWHPNFQTWTVESFGFSSFLIWFDAFSTHWDLKIPSGTEDLVCMMIEYLVCGLLYDTF